MRQPLARGRPKKAGFRDADGRRSKRSKWFDPSRCAQSVFASQVDPISKRKRSGKVLSHNLMRRQAAPAPPTALRRQRRAHQPRRVHRSESAQCAYHLTATMKNSGDARALARHEWLRRNLYLGYICGRQDLLAGQPHLRRLCQHELPLAYAVLPSSTRPHSHARTMCTYTFSCMFVHDLLWSVGRPAVCVCIVARAARRRPKKVMVAISSRK